MLPSTILKLDNDTYFELPLLPNYLVDYGLRWLETHRENALSAIAENAPKVIVTGAAAIDKFANNVIGDFSRTLTNTGAAVTKWHGVSNNLSYFIGAIV